MLKRILSFACLILSLATLAMAWMCLVNPHAALPYLIDIFTLPLLSATVVVCILFFVIKKKSAALTSLLAVLIFLAALWPQADVRQSLPDMTKPPLRVIFANIFVRNQHPERLLPWIATQKPDMVALVEANPHYRQMLIEGLNRTYPYVLMRYDMVIASRYPFLDQQPIKPGLALMTVGIATPQGPITLAVAHLTRPWPYQPHGYQAWQLWRVSDALKSLAQHRLIVLGDFNSSPSAALIQDFTRGLNMHTAPAVWGTWPWCLPPFLRITIDNAMASADINLSNRHVGPNDGSDHRPIVVDIRPAQN